MKLVITYETGYDGNNTYPFEYSSIEEAFSDIENQIDTYMRTGECEPWMGITVGYFLELIITPTDNLLKHYENAGVRVYTDSKWGRKYIYCKPIILEFQDWFEKHKLVNEE